MRTLQELTGQESGIVIYCGAGGTPEAIVCNWSNVQGYPRIDPCGLTVIGFGEEIPEVEGENTSNIPVLLSDVHIVYANGEDMPQSGTKYRIDDILIIAPEGWN
jgi:hypothetical protein